MPPEFELPDPKNGAIIFSAKNQTKTSPAEAFLEWSDFSDFSNSEISDDDFSSGSSDVEMEDHEIPNFANDKIYKIKEIQEKFSTLLEIVQAQFSGIWSRERNCAISSENFLEEKNHAQEMIRDLSCAVDVGDAEEVDVLRILFWKFWWWEPILMNFGDFDIDFKILEKSCHVCRSILGPILDNFDFEILVRSQSYNKPPWRNFDFLSQFEFEQKSQIWNPWP